MNNELLSPFERLLDDVVANEAEGWARIEASGYLDALVAEQSGGAGLTLSEIGPLLVAIGRRGLSLPIARQMAARALDIAPEALPRPLGAVLAAAQIVGTIEAMLELSVNYANDRQQFGKPIGKQQAVQHQLAILAEQTILARIAAQIGLAAGLHPSVERAAVAKSITSSAVPVTTAIAHAVHGAIGITRGHPLPRLVERAHRLREKHGSEGYWNRLLGDDRINQASLTSLDYIRKLGTA